MNRLLQRGLKKTYKNPKNDLVFVPVSATKSQMEIHPFRYINSLGGYWQGTKPPNKPLSHE